MGSMLNGCWWAKAKQRALRITAVGAPKLLCKIFCKTPRKKSSSPKAGITTMTITFAAKTDSVISERSVVSVLVTWFSCAINVSAQG